jgi:hypothetical protein
MFIFFALKTLLLNIGPPWLSNVPLSSRRRFLLAMLPAGL